MIQDLLDKNGLLDKDKCLKGMPLALKMALAPVIEWANKFDANNNKKPDVVEYMPILVKVLQIACAIAPHVDIPGVKTWFVGHDFVTDKAAVEHQFAQLEAVAEVAVKTAVDKGTK